MRKHDQTHSCSEKLKLKQDTLFLLWDFTKKDTLINLILASTTTNSVSWTTLIYHLKVLEVKNLKWVLKGLKYRCQLEWISCLFQLLEATCILWFVALSLYCFFISLTVTLIFLLPICIICMVLYILDMY